jgi:hypothetical protein
MDSAASVGVGVALIAITGLIYERSCPPLVDQRQAPPGEQNSTAAEKVARWTSAGVVGLVSIVTFDPTVFILGAGGVIVFSWVYRHANHAVNPLGDTSTPSSRNTATVEANVGPVMAGASVGLGY